MKGNCMQKVEKKKKKSLKHGRLVWIAAGALLLAGSIAAAVILSRPAATGDNPERHTEIRGTLVQKDAEELAALTMILRGSEAWTIHRNAEGKMELDGSEGWIADSQIAGMLTDAMTNLVYEDVLTDNPAEYREELHDFGLDEPTVTASAVYTDGSTVTVRIGGRTGLDEGWFYMTADGDDRLFAVSPGLVDDLNIERDLLHSVRQPEIYEALLDRIEAEDTRTGKKVCWALQGQITDRDAGTRWMITEPFRYPADEETIRNLKQSAGNLRMGIYLGDATEANLEKYGLAEPEKVLELHMAAGSTGTVSDAGVYDVTDREERTVRFEIGASGNELTDYVRYGDELFSVSHFTLSAFLDTDPLATAARYTAPVPLDSLESMEIERSGRTVAYTLNRTGSTEADSEEERVLCFRNGEEYTWEAFEAAYERLLTVTVSGRLPDGAKWEEPHTKYTFRTLSGGTHTVELCNWDGVHDAVVMDGECLFYLIRGGMEFE